VIVGWAGTTWLPSESFPAFPDDAGRNIAANHRRLFKISCPLILKDRCKWKVTGAAGQSELGTESFKVYDPVFGPLASNRPALSLVFVLRLGAKSLRDYTIGATTRGRILLEK